MAKVIQLDEKTFILDEERTYVITFKLEDEILNLIDNNMERSNYNSRSDLIRDAIVEYINYLKGKYG
ncbi:ribbon-helix-helix domain-containing protein [Saccharolobus caldissimus]|uniref:CopG family transcriptional regulator n=1 Tax=Saccharolobus caldissimus TaxID=1702097 RepID=A0AAQ4CQR7_9CREN|nr:ribbon-helix-helix domain-containing protein [Saccharolobus caldissimus]BDB98148.1 CopG family transcriptional regulator [Saccharolobus caldissimus]